MMRIGLALVLSFIAALTLLASPASAQSDYKKTYVSDMKAFVNHAQANYPFFDLKDIRKEWKATSKRLEKAAKKCKSDAELPVAVIIDAGCISAGETLARDFVNIAEARIFGGVSAGASSSKKNWTFPSGIATIKFSTRSRSGLDGKVIECHGITPHEITEVVPEEVLAGENSSIKRAEEYLLQR